MEIVSDAGFHLVDSSKNPIMDSEEGLLLYNEGTVCDDSFTNNSANAICREMGYHYARNWKVGLIWVIQNSYPINLDNVLCKTPYWDSCTFSTTHNCNHYEDVFLWCWCPTPSCSPGQYRHSCSCRECPADTFTSTHGTETTCNPCPEFSSSKPGSTYCSCKAGTFWNVTECQNCTQGLVSTEGSLQCTRCPAGSSATDMGTSCTCPDGMEWVWIGQSLGFCKMCPAGTYKNSLTKSCTNCPFDITSEFGSDGCVCPAGKFWNGSICQECPAGTVSEMGAAHCIPCPAGSITVNITSCSCPVGSYWVWDDQHQGSCQPCKPGTYKSVTTSLSCVSCPTESTSTGGSDHCSCHGGMFWNGVGCEQCPPGSVSKSGALQCTLCPPGSTALHHGTACSCSGGTTWEWAGRTLGSCQPCLAGTYKNTSVGSCLPCPSGYTSVTGSDHCSCGPGTFWNKTRCNNCSEGSVSNYGFLHCLLCPSGSKADPKRNSCSCSAGKTWKWDDLGNGSCRSVSLDVHVGTDIALICVSCVLAFITLSLGVKFVLMKLRIKKQSKSPGISYVVGGGVAQHRNEGAEWTKEDLDLGQAEPELYCVMNKAAQNMFRETEAVDHDSV
ncbi:hypothetical protein ACHWQZ_G018381 [Mnemiopsis leidyi]